ncbi:MAG: hypothetical protein ABL958_11555, partial [Bdellovibrionia bacterium]
ETASFLSMKRVEPTGKFNDYLVIAYQGKNFSGLEDDLEVMEFDPVTKQFTLRSLEFHKDRAARNEPNVDSYGTPEMPLALTTDRYRLSGDNPSLCLKCHRATARPNWTAYPRWPGAYGSNIFDMNEIRGFADFQRQSKPHGRYETLIDNAFGNRYTIGDDGTLFPKEVNNHNLNIFLNTFNRQRVAKLVSESKDYARYKHAIFAAALGCDDFLGYIPLAVREKEFVGDYQSLIEDSKKTFQISVRFSDYERELRAMAGLRYLFEGRGLEMQSWLMQRSRTKYELASIGQGIGQALIDGMIDNGDAEVKKMYSPLPAAFVRNCAELKAKSLSVLSGGR